jgi:nucleotide-binding universal stress UspA family protein
LHTKLPTVTLISVIEEPGSNTSAGDEMFEAQYQEQKQGAEAAAAELVAEGFTAKVLFAEGDARKMILRATEERKPDLLVLARHSHKPDRQLPRAAPSTRWSRSSTT